MDRLRGNFLFQSISKAITPANGLWSFRGAETDQTIATRGPLRFKLMSMLGLPHPQVEIYHWLARQRSNQGKTVQRVRSENTARLPPGVLQ